MTPSIPQNLSDDQVDYYAQLQVLAGWRLILASFARFVAPRPGARVLDVGCGAGALVDIFLQDYQADAYGADMAHRGLVLAFRRHPQAMWSRLSAVRLPHLPYADGSFDVVTATNVLYLVPNPVAALREMRRVLKVGGAVAMLNPSEQMSVQAATALADERGLTGFARENFIHWGEVAEANVRWSLQDIQALFAEAGLTLGDTQTRVGMGLARYAKGIR